MQTGSKETAYDSQQKSASTKRCEGKNPGDKHYIIPGQPKCLCGHYVKNYAKNEGRGAGFSGGS